MSCHVNVNSQLVKHAIFEMKFSNFSNEIFENILRKIVRQVKFSKLFCKMSEIFEFVYSLKQV